MNDILSSGLGQKVFITNLIKMMRPYKHSYLLKLIVICVIGSCSSGCFISDEVKIKSEVKKEALKRFGRKFNGQRLKSGVPLIPDKGWKDGGAFLQSNIGNAYYEKMTSENDSSARHALKYVQFSVDSLKPLREVDVYYLGKRYLSDEDPDYMEWERIVISYDYVTKHIKDQLLLNAARITGDHIKGKHRVYYFKPRPINVSLSEDDGDFRPARIVTLERNEISIDKAKSILHQWGLKA